MCLSRLCKCYKSSISLNSTGLRRISVNSDGVLSLAIGLVLITSVSPNELYDVEDTKEALTWVTEVQAVLKLFKELT